MRSWIVLAALGLLLAGCVSPISFPQQSTKATNASTPPPATPNAPIATPTSVAAPSPAANESVAESAANGTANASAPAAPTNVSANATTVANSSGPWPRPGSFVTYDVRGLGDNGCCSDIPYEANITFTYDGASWIGMCDLDSHKFTSANYSSGSSYHWANASASTGYRHAPPMGPTNTSLGDHPALTIFHGCTPKSTATSGWWFFTPSWTVVSNGTHDGHQVWLARSTSFWSGTEGMAWWDVNTGLVTAWSDESGSGGANGKLTATDAPLSTA